MNRYSSKETMRGYAIACASLINIYDRADMAIQLLNEVEITAADLPRLDLEPYDYQALSDVLKDFSGKPYEILSAHLEKSLREDEARARQ